MFLFRPPPRFVWKQKPTSAFERLLDRLEPEMRRAVREAATTMQGRLDLEAIALALESGSANRVERLVDMEQFLTTELRAAARTIVEAFQAGATLASDQMMRSYGFAIAFDVSDPRALASAEQRAATLVTAVTDDTRAAVRDIIADAFRNQYPSRIAARAIRQVVGLNERQATALANYRLGLLEQEVAPERILTLTDRYGARLLRQRADMIARTEISRASHEGQRELWREGIRNGQINPAEAREVWIANFDACDLCAQMNGQISGIDDSFDFDGEQIDGPPGHPNCLPGDTLVSPCGAISALSERRYDGDLLVIHTASGKHLACTPNHLILTSRGWMPARVLNVGSDVIGRVRSEGMSLSRYVNDQDVPSRLEQIAETARRSHHVTSVPVPLAPEDFHGDGKGSEVAIIRSYRLLGRGTTDTELVRQLICGRAGKVTPDEIIDIDVCDFRGHVFNLETELGAYVAGDIMTHNCRCSTGLQLGEAGES